MKIYNIDDVVQGKIDYIAKTHLTVELKNGWKGLLHISKISDYYVSNILSMFKVEERYWFKIIWVDSSKKRVKLCWKSIMPRFVKDPFDFNIEETPKGFINLKAASKERMKND